VAAEVGVTSLTSPLERIKHVAGQYNLPTNTELFPNSTWTELQMEMICRDLARRREAGAQHLEDIRAEQIRQKPSRPSTGINEVFGDPRKWWIRLVESGSANWLRARSQTWTKLGRPRRVTHAQARTSKPNVIIKAKTEGFQQAQQQLSRSPRRQCCLARTPSEGVSIDRSTGHHQVRAADHTAGQRVNTAAGGDVEDGVRGSGSWWGSPTMRAVGTG